MLGLYCLYCNLPAVSLLPPDAHGVVLVGQMLGAGGPVHRGAHTAEVVKVARGPREVLQAPTGRKHRAAALNLRDLYLPLPPG